MIAMVRGVLLFILISLASSAFAFDVSLRRINYSVGTMPDLQLTLSTDAKADIQSATVLLSVRPFVLRGVNSLDPNFRVTHRQEGRDLRLAVERIASDTRPGNEWINIVLSQGREGESHFTYFGEFPIRSAEMTDRSGSAIPNIRTRFGGWSYTGDVLFSYDVRVFDRDGMTPLPHALVIFELIGRAGLIDHQITDETGLVHFEYPLWAGESDFPYEDYLPDWDFVSADLRTGLRSGRFVVAPTPQSPHAFARYTLIKQIDDLEVSLHRVHPIILGEEPAGTAGWELYP